MLKILLINIKWMKEKKLRGLSKIIMKIKPKRYIVWLTILFFCLLQLIFGYSKEENPEWSGNYKVRYWYKEWQNIIYGNDSSYTKRILDSEFDGVYLDIIDAFEYFESQGQ